MRNFLTKIRSFSIYRNMLFVYLTSMLTVIILIVISSYGIFLNYTRKQTTYYLDQLMGQITYVFSSFIQQIQDANDTIIADDCFNKYVAYQTSNEIINYNLFFRLNEVQSYYPFIENISVANFDKNICISSQRSTVDELTFLNHILSENRNDGQMKIIYRKKEFERDSSRYVMDIMSAVQYLPEYNTAIVTDFPLEALSRSVSQTNRDNKLNAFYLVDDQQQIISPDLLEADPKVQENIRSFLSAPSSETTFVSYRSKQAYFFSQPEELNCWLVGLQDIASVYRQYQIYSLYFILLSLLLAIAGSALFWKYTNRTFSPLLILLEKYQHALPEEISKGTNEYLYLQKIIDKMAHEKYIHEAYIRQKILKTLLTQEEPTDSIPSEMSSWYKNYFLHPCYYVLVIQFTPPQPDESSSDMELLRFALKNVSEELFSSKADCFSTDIDAMHIAVILALKEPAPLNCGAEITHIRSLFQQTFHVEIKASLGHMVDVHGLADSYNRAIQYLKLNFHYNLEGFVDSNQYLEDRYLDKNIQLNRKIHQYIEENYSDVNLSIHTVAQEMHLSATYLGKLFKAMNDVPFSAYLSTLRLEKSRLLLHATTDTINIISEKVGFANPTYYTTLFKKKYGCTPTQYRSTQKTDSA